jgi:hypothetical protein
MKKSAVALLAIAPMLAVSWLFLGIEREADEHGSRFHFFIKQQPGLQVLFRNPVTCGECDLQPYESLSAPDQAEFSEFCKYRLGLDRPDQCYGIFKEQYDAEQALLRSRRQNL